MAKRGRPAAPGFVDVADTSWMALANCAGVDTQRFYPVRGEDTNAAKDVCRGCVVREACLEYALLRHEQHGIWGGCSERERRRIRRARAKAAASG